MGQIWLHEFQGGLDTRRLPETTPGGVLIKGTNGHITRGGEFEKRAAFVEDITLPEGTVGLARTRASIVVFGSGEEPVEMPANATYQRLQHPDEVDNVPFLVSVPSFDLYRGRLYVVGVFSDGSRHHFYDAVRVEDWFDGRATASFRITAGSVAGAGEVTDITVGGVSILGSPVSWTTSHAATATALAAEINGTTSAPDYSAVAVDDEVVIIAEDAGPEPNGFPVVVTTGGNLAITPASGIEMSGGADTTDGFTPGTFAKTIGAKMHSLSGPNWHFSGLQDPTAWTTDATGAGFVDLSSYESGSEELKSIGRYQDLLAIFSETNVQIWYTDPDPALNRQTQLLANTGTSAPRSVTQFGDSDLFYLDESGIRSLRARDASNAAATNDIGNPIDALVSEILASMDTNARERIIGLIEPRGGRFWLIMGDLIFVLSFFRGQQTVSAWTVYEPGFQIEDAVVFNRKVYLRSGNSVFVYGGPGDDLAYDETVAVAQTPYLDADRPTQKKTFTSFDVAARGEWKVYAHMAADDEDARDKIAVIEGTTYNADGTMPALGNATHISLEFRSQGIGPRLLGACVITHDLDDAED